MCNPIWSDCGPWPDLGPHDMNRMSQLVARYLQHRRNLGYRLHVEGGQLVDFARFADAVAPKRPMTIALALKWATLPAGRAQVYHAKRLELLRGFARYCHALDSRTEIPPMRLLGPAHRRLVPHIYSAAEVRVLLQRASALARLRPCQPQAFATLLGLAACTGMRSVSGGANAAR
jgi:integrase/recombinase XerD